jgi:pre-mRNA-splicing factor 18
LEQQERDRQRQGQVNTHLDIIKGVDTQAQLASMLPEDVLLKRQAETRKDKEKKSEVFARYTKDYAGINKELAATDPLKCSQLLYIFYKHRFHEWEQDLDTRHNPREEMILYRQSLDHVKPFFKSLKSNTLDEDLLSRVADIAMHIHQREYIKANDAYLRMSIGNAAWPIGVTGVNIHERSAMDKITTSQVAHVLNDESTRKWVQCIKRIITLSQRLHPPSDPTKVVMN